LPEVSVGVVVGGVDAAGSVDAGVDAAGVVAAGVDDAGVSVAGEACAAVFAPPSFEPPPPPHAASATAVSKAKYVFITIPGSFLKFLMIDLVRPGIISSVTIRKSAKTNTVHSVF